MSVKTEAFYSSKQWKAKKKYILSIHHYMCYICNRYGIHKDAKVVHHLTPLKSNWNIKLETYNLLPLCTSCHNKCHNRNYDTLTKFGQELKEHYYLKNNIEIK